MAAPLSNAVAGARKPRSYGRLAALITLSAEGNKPHPSRRERLFRPPTVLHRTPRQL